MYYTDISGFRYRVLFYRYGYTPHYAEHIIDPRDGREKLVLADPHERQSVIIYDMENKVIEWEYRVPGNTVPNPHTAHIVMDTIPEINAKPGDIICADRDNRWIVIDRDSREIKWTLSLEDTGWAHDIIISKDFDGIIVTDYSAFGKGGFVRKIDFDRKIRWSISMPYAAKLSPLYGYTKSAIHSDSMGGRYIVVQNSEISGVYEVDENGNIVWKCPKAPGTLNNIFLHKPHSAFRMGLAELSGNITVVGLEAGGGIIAIDSLCRPRWGLITPFSYIPYPFYKPSRYGVMETTHVFPTLWGTIGAIDWKGRGGSMVIEILSLPRSPLPWILAWEFPINSREVWLDPPIEALEFDDISIMISNIGNNTILWEVYGTLQSFIAYGIPMHWKKISSGLLAKDDSIVIDIDNHRKMFSFIRLKIGVEKEGEGSKVNIFIVWR